MKEIKISLPNLIDRGLKQLAEKNVFPGARVNRLNKALIEKAERKERISTEPLVNQRAKSSGRAIGGMVVEGKGKARPKSKSWAIKVVPIFRKIVSQKGEKAIPDGDESLEGNRRIVEMGHPILGTSLAGKALMADYLIQRRQDDNFLAEESQQRQQRAQEILRQMQITEARCIGLEPPSTSSGLSPLATATLIGMPRAGTESFAIDLKSKVLTVDAPTRPIGQTNIPLEQAVKGTLRPECKVDRLSWAVNFVRSIVGQEPIALFNRGIIYWRHIPTDEIVVGQVEQNPFGKLTKINEVIKAIRDLSEPVLPRLPEPTFTDLGLSGSELEAQSGVHFAP